MLKPQNFIPFGPTSDDTNDSNEAFQTTHYHHGSRTLHDYIVTWREDVEEAASLPPLTIISTAPRNIGRPQHYLGPKNHFLQISLPIPREISDDIRSQLSRTVNTQNPITLLRNLPHPKNTPLVSPYFIY